jgi:hypothetical protein
MIHEVKEQNPGIAFSTFCGMVNLDFLGTRVLMQVDQASGSNWINLIQRLESQRAGDLFTTPRTSSIGPDHQADDDDKEANNPEYQDQTLKIH